MRPEAYLAVFLSRWSGIGVAFESDICEMVNEVVRCQSYPETSAASLPCSL